MPPDLDRSRFVTFVQNHDQVGNRGFGDRPDSRLPRGTVMAGAALLLLGPFTPLLFQGQEWGTGTPFLFFTDHEGELGAAVFWALDNHEADEEATLAHEVGEGRYAVFLAVLREIGGD